MLSIGLAALAIPAQVLAELPPVSLPENLSAVLDIRIVGSDGERSWMDGGFGKARFGPHDGGFSIDPVAAEVIVVWQPPLSWNLRGTISIAVKNDTAKEGLEALDVTLFNPGADTDCVAADTPARTNAVKTAATRGRAERVILSSRTPSEIRDGRFGRFARSNRAGVRPRPGPHSVRRTDCEPVP